MYHTGKARRNTTTQLLLQHQKLLEILASQSNADVILDFSNVIYFIDFNIMLKKITNLGVNGNFLLWIHSFLTSRRQRLRIEGNLSDWVSQPQI